MNSSSIGVGVNDFKLPIKDALRQAADLRFRTVELAAINGDVAPSELSTSGRRHLSRYVDGLGLRLASLSADMTDARFTDPATVQERIDRTCAVLELAADLRVPVVTASTSSLTDPVTGEPLSLAAEALKHIGEFADLRGTAYAIRSSLDTADRLERVLDEVRCDSIQIGLDPAALVMSGVNAVTVVQRFAGRIGLVHIRDGTSGRAESYGHETRLGDGDVDLVGVLGVLGAAEFHGSYLIRRSDSDTPLADIEHARDLLDRFWS